MPILSNFWNRIIEWFEDRQSRAKLVRNFNQSAREAFVLGITPVLMQAKIVRGDPNYRHQFSNWLEGSGFRIKTLSGRQLTKQEIVNIGETILADDLLVRRMVVLGWDTLQVHCDVGNHGCQWQLHDYLLIS
ncbi:MAG: hypothetical protein IJ684_06675 [Bacteroidales bacterium]|nr:hypothetical protein [Bacteroidales bacterium]